MPLSKISANGISSITTLIDTASGTGYGAINIPTGTTAQRPSSPRVGYVRFNSDTQLLENYTANGWIKVSVNVPTITSISGSIYSGNTSTLTINGINFGAGFAGTVTYTAGANTATASATPTSELLITTTVPATVYGWAAGTSVAVTFTNSGGGVSSAYNMTIVGLPTGGTVTSSGNTRIHTFNSSSSLVVPTGFTATASYLIVAGGGSGASVGANSGGSAGGGGAGGMVSGSASLSSGTTYTVTVGAGGVAQNHLSPVGGLGFSGSNSSFTLIGTTVLGGGGGGTNNYPLSPGSPLGGNGVPGGSGGGAAGNAVPSTIAGSGTPGQGNPGGAATLSTPSGGGTAGGGGGAGAAGGSGTPSAQGAGGIGLSSSITGSPVYYAGGGGAGGNFGPPSISGASGGSGGGGAGAPYTNSGTAGTTNLGGGGGGSGTGPSGSAPTILGGNGGSGVVIVSYTI